MNLVASILAAGLFPPNELPCEIFPAEPFQYRRPLFDAPDQIAVPDVRLESLILPSPDGTYPSCNGIGTVTFSVSKDRVLEGYGLVVEQIDPAVRIHAQPNGAFWSDESSGQYSHFLFTWHRSVLRNEPVSVTLRFFIVDSQGNRGRDMLLRYVLPPKSAL